MRRISIHIIHNMVEIKVGIIKKEKRKLHIGEQRNIMMRITVILVREHDQEEVRIIHESMIYCRASLIR